MLFRIKENEILMLVEDFLKSQKLLGSLRSLEKESKVVLGDLDEDTLFLRDLVMEGEWANVLEYLNPVRGNQAYEKIRLMIEKQRYLELLATEKGNYDAGQVMKSLSVLEDLCPTRHEYTSLCYLLTRAHLTHHPAYASWSRYLTRLQCFQEIKTSLFQQETREEKLPSTGRLVDLLTKGMFYESALQLCSQKVAPGGCVNISDSLTNNLLQCTVPDKEAILLHWLYKIPTSALVKPTQTKIVQVELETSKRPSSARVISQSSVFSKSRDTARDTAHDIARDTPHQVYSSIDRTTYPLDSALRVARVEKAGESGSDSLLKEEVEMTLGDSEVAIDVCQDSSIDGLYGGENYVWIQNPKSSTPKSPTPHKEDMSSNENISDPSHKSLLDVQMGFRNIELVEVRDNETQNEAQFETQHETQHEAVRVEAEDATKLRTSNTEEQDEKIRWLQKQLNELRLQQDSLRMTSAIEQAGRIQNHGTPEEPRTPTKPLYVHPNNMGSPCRGSPSRGSPSRGSPSKGSLSDIEPIPQPTELKDINLDPLSPGTLMDDVTYSVGADKTSKDAQGVANVLTHSAVSDRGTNLPVNKKPVPSCSGWVEGSQPSLHTLESFSEDSLRPCKTSTPCKTSKNVKVAESAMLKVKFAPSAVLEDVQPIRCAAFHPSGDLVAIGSNSKALRVCSCHMLSDSVQTLVREDGCQDLPVLFKRNRHHKGSVYSVAWNTDGNVLATGSNDKSIVVVGFNADNCISTGADREFLFHKGTVRDIHFLDSTNMLSVGGGDNLLHLTDINQGVEVAAFSGHTATIHAVTSHKDVFVTGSEDATIRLWDKRTNLCSRVVGAAIGAKGNSVVGALSLNNFGNLLCAGRDDGLCMLYDIEMGKLLAAFSPHTPAPCKSVQFYRNPRYILTASYDGTVALTCAEQVLLNPDLPCTEILGTHRDKVTMAAWHPTKQAFVTCSADRTACLWAAREGVQD